MTLPAWLQVAIAAAVLAAALVEEARYYRTRVNRHGAVIRRGQVLGWVRADGCENEHCRPYERHGMRWHAVPAGFGMTLPRYHYLTRARAVHAVVAAADSNPRAMRQTERIRARIAAGN